MEDELGQGGLPYSTHSHKRDNVIILPVIPATFKDKLYHFSTSLVLSLASDLSTNGLVSRFSLPWIDKFLGQEPLLS